MDLVLQDVLYMLDLYGNLLSILHLACCSTKVCFLREGYHIYNQQKSLILKGGLCNNLYIIKLQVSGPILVTTNVAIFDTHTIDIS
jgi:hypothetical protein